MKNNYEKPVLEIITFNYDVLTASAGNGTGESEIDVGDDWYPGK